MSSELPQPPLPPLGELEAEVLRLLWQQGPSSAESVRVRLERRLKESTIRTVLRRLEEKGYAEHEVQGRTFIFQAAAPASEVAERSVRRLAAWLYQGSVAELLVGLVGGSRLAPQELDRLADLIARARREPQ